MPQLNVRPKARGRVGSGIGLARPERMPEVQPAYREMGMTSGGSEMRTGKMEMEAAGASETVVRQKLDDLMSSPEPPRIEEIVAEPERFGFTSDEVPILEGMIARSRGNMRDLAVGAGALGAYGALNYGLYEQLEDELDARRPQPGYNSFEREA